MMRSLWTAASGMVSQQQNVDTISNNLANVNTSGYKKERLEFKSLLYETIKRADLDPVNQTGRPVNLQIGHGVRPIATSKVFTTGNFQNTELPLDFAIEGKGFFVVQHGNNGAAFTRDGSFKISLNEDGSMGLVTSDGYAVLNVEGEAITLPQGYTMERLVVEQNGLLAYTNLQNELEDLGMQMDIVQFSNVQGLESIGNNLLKQTVASGAPIQESAGEVTETSSLRQGVLEMSNVQVAEEMVNLIVAQRAYELNSKAIQTSDDMLQLANNLKR